LILFRDGKLVGHPEGPAGEIGKIAVAPRDWPQQLVDATRFDVVKGLVLPMDQLIGQYSGHMFRVHTPEWSEIADNAKGNEGSSPVFVFEDDQQLRYPHSVHAHITQYGAGRFSHWGQELLFSTTDNTDPRTNGRRYSIVVAKG
jgi:hypothetical protein